MLIGMGGFWRISYIMNLQFNFMWYLTRVIFPYMFYIMVSPKLFELTRINLKLLY